MSWTLRRPANPCTVPTPQRPQRRGLRQVVHRPAQQPQPGCAHCRRAFGVQFAVGKIQRARPAPAPGQSGRRPTGARSRRAAGPALLRRRQSAPRWKTTSAKGGGVWPANSLAQSAATRAPVSASRPGLGLISTLAHRLWSLSNCAASARLGSGSSAKRGENQAPASSRDSTFHDSASAGPWPSVVRSSVSSCSKTARRQRTGARRIPPFCPGKRRQQHAGQGVLRCGIAAATVDDPVRPGESSRVIGISLHIEKYGASLPSPGSSAPADPAPV